MSKLTNENTSETSKNVTPLPLRVILNTFNTSIHCSIERRAATAQINPTFYHSFLSCQPLAAPQNMSPTRTGNPTHDPHGYLTSQIGDYMFWYLKTTNKI